MEYIIYCDESSQSGAKFGDFFGGCIVNSKDLIPITNALNQCKQDNNLLGEIKWNKLTENYLQKYINVIDLFFNYIEQGKIKMRVMFRNINDNPSVRYTTDDKYFKLYYQFLKHSFGLMRIPSELGPVFTRIYLDQLPDKTEKSKKFKQALLDMPDTLDFQESNLHIRQSDIAEVISHDHVILQCVDIVLGSMYFRLNDLHKVIPDGQKRRGKRTVAKEKLFDHISQRIRQIVPYFNIGISTGNRNSDNPHWEAPYEHWRFVPK